MEATGYAAVMADLCAEQIYLAEYRDNDQDPPVKWVNGIAQFPTQSIPPRFRIDRFYAGLHFGPCDLFDLDPRN